MRRSTIDILEVLVNHIEENSDIKIKKNEQLQQRMSFFTVKEIEMHSEGSRKMPRLSIIVNTLDCSRKFKEGRDVVET